MAGALLTSDHVGRVYRWRPGLAPSVCLFCLIPCQGKAQQASDSSLRGTAAKVEGPHHLQPSLPALTGSLRLHNYLYNLVSPLAVIGSAASAGIGQWRDVPGQWKQGGAGYGRRFASAMAQHIAGQTILSGAAALLKEDTRYVPSPQAGFRRRLEYALLSTVSARGPDGLRRLSLPKISAFVGAAIVSRAWQPPSTAEPHNALSSLGASLSVAAGFNVLREFLPRRFRTWLGPT